MFLTYATSVHYVGTREALLERAGDLFRWLGEGSLRVHIGGGYPLEEAGRAHADLEGRGTQGKLLLVPRFAASDGGAR